MSFFRLQLKKPKLNSFCLKMRDSSVEFLSLTLNLTHFFREYCTILFEQIFFKLLFLQYQGIMITYI